jgi:DeoR/GlpR family transcriptional regulator of sugar metabolism
MARAGVLDGVQDVAPVLERLTGQLGVGRPGSASSVHNFRTVPWRLMQFMMSPGSRTMYNGKSGNPQVIDFRFLLVYGRQRILVKEIAAPRMAKRSTTRREQTAVRTESSAMARQAGVPGADAQQHPGSAGMPSRLLGETRRARMLEWLREEGSARVSALAAAFDVSEVTVRQDLEKLEADGHVVREHGGAYLKSVPDQVRAMALQHQGHRAAKQAIGRAAAALVSDGETIILDSGSTTTEVAANLFGRRGITVITNALNIALMLGGEPGFDVHMTGGHFKAPTLSLSGEKSAEYFRGLYAQKLFLATAALDPESGLTYPALSDIAVKRAMIESARTIYLVADSSKIGARSFCVLGGLEPVDALVTDAGISEAQKHAIEATGVEVIVAS